MIDRITKWLIKRLVFFWDRRGNKMAFSFGRDERTEYSIIVDHYFDDYWTSGTQVRQYDDFEAEVSEDD